MFVVTNRNGRQPSEANSRGRPTHSKQSFKIFTNDVTITLFTDEKTFTATTPKKTTE